MFWIMFVGLLMFAAAPMFRSIVVTSENRKRLVRTRRMIKFVFGLGFAMVFFGMIYLTDSPTAAGTKLSEPQLYALLAFVSVVIAVGVTLCAAAASEMIDIVSETLGIAGKFGGEYLERWLEKKFERPDPADWWKHGGKPPFEGDGDGGRIFNN